MIWQIVRLLRPITEKDALGNDKTVSYELVMTTRCRPSPWTAAEIAAEPARTKNERRFVIPAADRAKLEGVAAAVIDGSRHDVTKISQAAPRWVYITCTGWRDGI